VAGCVVSGSGLVTAAGDDARALCEALARCAAATPTDPPSPRPIDGFDVRRYLARKGAGQLSRVSQLCCAAAARLQPGLAGVPPAAVGVVLGTAWAGLASIVRFEHEAHMEGPRFVDPVLFTETVANVPAGHVSIVFGWSALNATVACGATSGLAALGLALDLLEEGRAEVVVAGGADAPEGHAADPQGAAAGEAACLLALESADHARARGVRPLGRLCGLGVWPVAAADVARAASLTRGLVDAAGRAPGEIGVVVCCGGSASDAAAAAALGAAAAGARRLALQPAVGQTWGASGALGLAVGLQRLREPDGGDGRRCGLIVGDPAGGDFGAALIEVEP